MYASAAITTENYPYYLIAMICLVESVPGLITAAIFSYKGRSKLAGFFVGFFFSWLGILVSLFLSKQQAPALSYRYSGGTGSNYHNSKSGRSNHSSSDDYSPGENYYDRQIEEEKNRSRYEKQEDEWKAKEDDRKARDDDYWEQKEARDTQKQDQWNAEYEQKQENERMWNEYKEEQKQQFYEDYNSKYNQDNGDSYQELISNQLSLCMKTLLVLSYYFIPAAVVGTHRIDRFVKYLPDYGWRSIIVTVDEKYYDLLDPTISVGHDPELNPIHRTRTIDWPAHDRVYRQTQSGGMLEVKNNKTIRSLLLAKKLGNYFAIPDTKNGWYPFAIRKCLQIMKNTPVDAILTTSFPYTSHIIGYSLKKITGKPLVVDLRDPWAEYAFLFPSTKFHQKVACLLERSVFNEADAIIANTGAAREKLCLRYPLLHSKITSISNGFDFDQFKDISITAKKREFVITHAGTIFPGMDRRSPMNFLKAVSGLLRDHPELKSYLKIKFIGHIHPDADVQSLTRKLGLEENVDIVGYLGHQDFIHQLVASDVLLLIHHSGKPINKLYSTIPAKTYEYFGAMKPILCLSSHGAIQELISKMQIGICVDPLEPREISRAIVDLFSHYATWCQQIRKNSAVWEYEARSLTSQLACCLERVID